MSANTYHRGLECEALVAEYYRKLGYEILSHRIHTPFSEIDIVVQNSQEVLLLEVKSLSANDWIQFRVSQRQRQRLLRALSYMQCRFKLPVRLHLATVTKGGEIEIYKDFLS